MTQGRQRKDQSARKRRQSGFGRVEEAGADGLRVITLWAPVPAWVPALTLAGIAAAAAAGVAASAGSDGDSVLTVVAIAFVAGYFGSAVAWAVLGAAGGDRQVLLLDLAADTGQVEQSLLWRWKRAAAFDLDDVDRVYVWSSRGLPLRLTRTHMVAIAFETQKPLSLGEYHTDGEAMAIASPVASFLDVPVRRNEKPGKRKGARR